MMHKLLILLQSELIKKDFDNIYLLFDTREALLVTAKYKDVYSIKIQYDGYKFTTCFIAHINHTKTMAEYKHIILSLHRSRQDLDDITMRIINTILKKDYNSKKDWR